MNLTRTMTDLSNVYSEKVTTTQELKDTFAFVNKKQSKKASKKGPFVQKDSGPENADNVKKDIIDPKTSKKGNFFEPEKFSQKNEKTEVTNINNFMNKSIFDKLYEDVMSENFDETEAHDAEALGLPGEGEGEHDGGEESGDEVTIKLDRDLALKLHDVLMEVLGEHEGEPEGSEAEGEDEGVEGSEDAEEEDKEEEDEVKKEATELTALPNNKGLSLQSKNNKVGDETAKLVSKGHGDGKIDGEVDGDGKPVSDSKGKSLQSKSNKVASETSKVGAYLAGLKK